MLHKIGVQELRFGLAWLEEYAAFYKSAGNTAVTDAGDDSRVGAADTEAVSSSESDWDCGISYEIRHGPRLLE